MFKALFGRARNRAEYIALWTGRPVPSDVARWSDRPIDAIAAHFDSIPATPESAAAAREAVLDGVRRSSQQGRWVDTSGSRWGVVRA